jgi:hypothetical protein
MFWITRNSIYYFEIMQCYCMAMVGSYTTVMGRFCTFGWVRNTRRIIKINFFLKKLSGNLFITIYIIILRYK